MTTKIHLPLFVIFDINKSAYKGEIKMIRRSACTEQTVGNIVDIKCRNSEGVAKITVRYNVNGMEYTIRESLKLISKMIKVGGMPIGQRKVPRLGNVKIGTQLRVQYNPSKPQKAFLSDNVGRINE